MFDLTPETIDRVLDGFTFPARFDFGVASSGYQSEGGFNGPEEPKNNWYWAEYQGRKVRTGPAARFLDFYAEDLDRAKWIGSKGFRLGIEWPRLQPSADPYQVLPPPFSPTAAAQYAEILAAVFARGMYPAVTLHHFTNPLWAGMDFWLDWGRVRELFGAYVEYAVTEINRRLIADHACPPIPYFITINEPISVPMTAYVLSEFPRGDAKGLRAMAKVYANLLRAHVLAYRIIQRVYAERGWARPTVTCNTWCGSVYTMDKLAQDLFLARQNGVPRAAVPQYLASQRRRMNEHVRAIPFLQGPQWPKRTVESALEKLLWHVARPAVVEAVTEEAYAGDDPRVLDVLAFDLYDPFQGNNLDLSWRGVRVRARPFEWNVNPRVLDKFLASYGWTAGELPLHLLEHGMSYGDLGQGAQPREDGVTRDVELKAAMVEVVKALRAGRRLETFFYWSLTDNYEWGSFEPRFGLFGLDYNDGARRLKRDALGINAGGCFRAFADAFARRDTGALRAAFLADSYPEYPS